MRVFWPRNISRNTGTAVGWRLKASANTGAGTTARGGGRAREETLVVVDVVDNFEQKEDIAPPLERLALVLAEPSSSPSTSKTAEPSSQRSGDSLTIWASGGQPTTYSAPAETVLFHPPWRKLAHFTLGRDEEQDGASDIERRLAEYGPASASRLDLDALLQRLNAVSDAQARLRGTTDPTAGGTWQYLWTGLLLVSSVFLFFRRNSHTDPSAWDIVRRDPSMAMQYLALAFMMYLPAATGGLVPVPSVLLQISSVIAPLARMRLPSALVHQLGQRAADVHKKGVAKNTAILLDMLLGLMANLLLRTRSSSAFDIDGGDLADDLTHPVVAALHWLNDWPFGLKLNTGLSDFLCASIARALELWGDYAAPILSLVLPHVPTALALVLPLGLSFGIALFADLVSLVTLHLRLVHRATAALCRVSMSGLKGLWDLFRGRRWNVLRHRTDSHAFEVDTLFLGTLLFTVVAFLAPTVLAYGLLFALIKLGRWFTLRALSLAVAGLNCSVAFQLISALAQAHIPDGIVFDLVPSKAQREAGAGHHVVLHMLELKSMPLGIGKPVAQWWRETVRTAR